MDVEVVFVLDVVAAKLAEAGGTWLACVCFGAYFLEQDILSLVPSDNVADTNLVQSGEEGKGSEKKRRNDGLELVEKIKRRFLLDSHVSMAGYSRAIDGLVSSSYLLGELLIVLGLSRLDIGAILRLADGALAGTIANIGAGGNSLLGSHGVGLQVDRSRSGRKKYWFEQRRRHQELVGGRNEVLKKKRCQAGSLTSIKRGRAVQRLKSVGKKKTL